MNNNLNGYDLIIPVFNEINIIKLIDYINSNTKNLLNIYICYDSKEDKTIKILKDKGYNNSKNIILVKNSLSGPCEAIKTGIEKSNASSLIIYQLMILIMDSF